MKDQGKIFIGVFFSFSLFFSISAIASNFVPLRFDEWTDRAIRRLATNGIIAEPHTRPPQRSQIRRAVENAKLPKNEIDRKFLEKLRNAFQIEDSDRFQFRGSIELRSEWQRSNFSPAFQFASLYRSVNKKITLYQEFEISNFAEKYPDQATTAEKRINLWLGGYIGDFKRVFVEVPIGDSFHFKFGRDLIFWGSGDHDAIGISTNSPPFDLIQISGDLGPVRLTAFTAKLDRIWHTKNLRYLADRYFAGHRVDWRVNDRTRFAVSELVIYGGDGRDLSWFYTNPILPYYASQHNFENLLNAQTNDNVMFLFDGSIRPIDGTRIYGEFMIDDFSYADRDDPNDLAFLIGFSSNNFLSSRQLTISAEYARINRWTYTHLVEENQFTHFGSIIGHRIGNDADQFSFCAIYNHDQDLSFGFFTERDRKGSATVADRFRGDREHLGLSFPSGEVRKTTKFGIDLRYEPLTNFQFVGRIQKVLSSEKDQFEFYFRLRYGFSIKR